MLSGEARQLARYGTGKQLILRKRSDVDLGRNPAAYVARCAEETTIANQARQPSQVLVATVLTPVVGSLAQATKGRIQAFAELQTTLLDLRNHVQK